jgi:hypothetical protein
MEQEAASRPSLTGHQKAVIFTHFGELKYRKNELEFEGLKRAYQTKYTDILQSYLQCAKDGSEIGLVYVYIDWAVRQAVPTLRANAFHLDTTVLNEENTLVGLLKICEDSARRNLGLNRAQPPQFQYVGIVQLVDLLNHLIDVDDKLVEFLAGPENRFTYDSPKFVEAVIRLARGETPQFADHPIIRIDEDAKPTAAFITHLLNVYVQIRTEAPFFFFSGTYGRPHGAYDPINDHAVRLHWLADVPQRGEPQLTNQQMDKARAFLADLNELGATQIPDSNQHYSKALRSLLAQGRQEARPSRSRQVISGAGLIMSRKAVNVFPPFMNFKHLTVWVDDHLKRRLHEVAGDLYSDDIECTSDAKIQQTRHDHLGPGDIAWAQTEYFDRLLRGCLFRRLISHLNGRRTTYTELLADIVRYRVSAKSAEELGLTVDDPRSLEMIDMVKERYKETILCWQSREFADTPLEQWAGTRDSTHCLHWSREVVADAIRYVDLLLRWPVFTRAIERLQFTTNYWLFCPVT